MAMRINTMFEGWAAKPHVESRAGVWRGEMTQALTACSQLTAQTFMLAVLVNIVFRLRAISAKKEISRNLPRCTSENHFKWVSRVYVDFLTYS